MILVENNDLGYTYDIPIVKHGNIQFQDGFHGQGKYCPLSRIPISSIKAR